MFDLFLFCVIVAVITHGIIAALFNAKVFIGVRTSLVCIRNHAHDNRSYLLYLISDLLLSRTFMSYIVAWCVGAATYYFTFTPQPANIAFVMIFGAGIFAAGVIDFLHEVLPVTCYPEDDWCGHYFPWHYADDEEDDSDSSFQDEASEDNSETVHEGSVLGDDEGKTPALDYEEGSEGSGSGDKEDVESELSESDVQETMDSDVDTEEEHGEN